MNFKKDYTVLAKSGVVAALYIVLTLKLAPISYGAVQFRVSEILNLLAFYNPMYAPGIILGCLVSNMFSPFGVIDVVFGTLSTCFSMFFITRSKNLFIASLWPTVSCVIIGLEIAIIEHLAFVPFVLTTISVMAGEFTVVTLVGYPLFTAISKNKAVCYILKR